MNSDFHQNSLNYLQPEQSRIDEMLKKYPKNIKHIDDSISLMLTIPNFLPHNQISPVFLGFYSQIYREMIRATLSLLRGYTPGCHMLLRNVFESAYLAAYSLYDFKEQLNLAKDLSTKNVEKIVLQQLEAFGVSPYKEERVEVKKIIKSEKEVKAKAQKWIKKHYSIYSDPFEIYRNFFHSSAHSNFNKSRFTANSPEEISFQYFDS